MPRRGVIVRETGQPRRALIQCSINATRRSTDIRPILSSERHVSDGASSWAHCLFMFSERAFGRALLECMNGTCALFHACEAVSAAVFAQGKHCWRHGRFADKVARARFKARRGVHCQTGQRAKIESTGSRLATAAFGIGDTCHHGVLGCGRWLLDCWIWQ